MFKSIAVTILLLALCYFGYPKLWKEAKVADKDESKKKESV
jgi:uncharacterized protein YjeT (DUF2065 family)